MNLLRNSQKIAMNGIQTYAGTSFGLIVTDVLQRKIFSRSTSIRAQ